MKRVTPVAALACAVIVGCFQTKSEVEVKPIDVNLNITGRMELDITEARRQEREITGSPPKRTVRPEDIGLPPAAATPGPQSDATSPDAVFLEDGSAGPRLVLVSEIIPVQAAGDSEAQLI